MGNLDAKVPILSGGFFPKFGIRHDSSKINLEFKHVSSPKNLILGMIVHRRGGGRRGSPKTQFWRLFLLFSPKNVQFWSFLLFFLTKNVHFRGSLWFFFPPDFFKHVTSQQGPFRHVSSTLFGFLSI